jgi:hypothetical protein
MTGWPALASAVGEALMNHPGALAIVAGALAIASLAPSAAPIWDRLTRRQGNPSSSEPLQSSEPLGLLAAIALAICAQQLILRGALAAGAALYVAALALVLVRQSPSESPAAQRSGTRTLELAAIAVVAAAFAGVCLHHLDTYPLLVFDEETYLVAARIALEQIPPTSIAGPIAPDLYRLERFEVQPIPFALQRLAVWLADPGLMATRIASVAAASAALVVGMLAIRRHLGAVHAIGAGILWSCSPLFLSFGRTGLYVVFTILHSVLCLSVLLRFLKRWDARSGALLGVLLGASLYFYQLSWFVPVLVALVLAAQLLSAGLDRSRLSKLALVGVLALVTLAPALLLPRAGFEQLLEQSKDRGVRPSPGQQVAMVRLPGPAEDAVVAGELEALAQREVTARPLVSSRGDRILTLAGHEDAISASLADLRRGDSWQTIALTHAGPVWNVAQALARVFYERPGLGDDARLNHSLLLNPLVTPLFMLGLAEAFRRRRQPVVRALLVWVVAALVLPWAATGPAPRRMVLALPVIQCLAMLPLVALWAPIRTCGRRTRGAAVAAIGLYLAASVCVGLHLFFDAWQDPLTRPPNGHFTDRLELTRSLRALPMEDPIFVTTDDPGLERHLGVVQGMTHIQVLRSPTASVVRSAACGEKMPQRWVAATRPGAANPVARLAKAGFEIETEGETGGGYPIVRVDRVEPGGCSR